MKQIILAITGASGAVYAQRLAACLVERDVHLHLVISPYGQRVMADELDVRRASLEALLGHTPTNATVYPYHDQGARIASGSFLTHGMVVCPCSSNSLGAIASGAADNLIARAAAVTLKERRRLILVPRETPLSLIEVQNMLRITEAGGIICPASPGFYLRPQSVAELVDFVVGRVLDLLEVPHDLHTRWDPQKHARPGGHQSDGG